MPAKWKIFFALNIVLSLPALVCFILLFINMLDSSGGDFFIAYLILFGLLMVTANGFLNIYILQRFFPDKLIPSNIKGLNIFSLIMNILTSVAVLILCIYGASIEFSRYNAGRDMSGKIILAVIFILWLVQAVVLVMQGQLPGLISRNNRNKISSLIDSIGK